MPPDKMAARNLEAELIVVGRVIGTGKILLPEKNKKFTPPRHVFALEVIHVIKGYGKVSAGDHLNIVYQPKPEPKGKLSATTKYSKRAYI